tara:strand:+ start:720 stop:1478 length:759 start_codon:yes stop_codon:yes gene_type:complete
MAQTPLVKHVLKNVEARYPKLNQPYRYDTEATRKGGGKGQTVPCSADAPNARWELGIRMDAEAAQSFMQAYAQAWQQSPYSGESMPDPTVLQGEAKTPQIKNEGDGFFVIQRIHKNCKSAAGKLQSAPIQVGRDAKPVAEDFELTTGSTINLEMVFYPHKISGRLGVSFWINAMQLVELAERQPVGAFTALDEPEEQAGSPFAALDEQPKPQVKTRKKKAAKEASAEEPKTDLNDILSKFAPPADGSVDDND